MGYKVKCANCGLLSFRIYKTGQFVEATAECRSDGAYPSGVLPNGETAYTDPSPFCFVRAHDLLGEYQTEIKIIVPNGAVKLEPQAQARMIVIGRDRECGKWCDWQQGWTPREHKEMLAEQERSRRQDERDQQQRDFQSQQAAIARKSSRISLAIALVVPPLVALFSAWLNSKPEKPPVVNVYPKIQVVSPTDSTSPKPDKPNP